MSDLIFSLRVANRDGVLMNQAANEIERLRRIILDTRTIIVEGAAVGFNPLAGGDWAERLYRNNANLTAGLKDAV